MDKNFLLIECELSQHLYQKVEELESKGKKDQDD
jgi:hypothetical protein